MEFPIHLSPPNVDSQDIEAVRVALESGWVAPVGPSLDAFEKALESYFPTKRVLSLNSGTSALHLSLALLGISDGDHVVVSSLTFAACANVILYERAIPVFMDSEENTWNLDPICLSEYLNKCIVKPKAIIVTHLYGVPANMNAIMKIAQEHQIPVVEDAAESLGSTYRSKHVGGFGDYGVLSFNGNKIITTSGGGALILDHEGYDRGLHLATQANSGHDSYHHEEAGFNYRMSNVLGGLGLSQLSKLADYVDRKREIFDMYQQSLSGYFTFNAEEEETFCNRWLTVGLMKEGSSPIALIEFLKSKQIETRRLWKPLHLHPAYHEADFIGTGVCERLFEKGICLPSGTSLSTEQQAYVINEIRLFFESQ